MSVTPSIGEPNFLSSLPLQLLHSSTSQAQAHSHNVSPSPLPRSLSPTPPAPPRPILNSERDILLHRILDTDPFPATLHPTTVTLQLLELLSLPNDTRLGWIRPAICLHWLPRLEKHFWDDEESVWMGNGICFGALCFWSFGMREFFLCAIVCSILSGERGAALEAGLGWESSNTGKSLTVF